ncbi:MAG: hypothetical protein IPI13_07665 [Actinomycetales bacterium]|uniref:Uncharacterized protein n=1 Tax=Candidatus Phosphoribacter hodrii TaxID=2953743 RepID=A0A935M591_9MICO|nr:hypothetical protein [Candidatus Phosphoribacter hodrii]
MVPRARGHGTCSLPPGPTSAFVRAWTSEWYAASRNAALGPLGKARPCLSPVRTQSAKAGSRSIRAVVNAVGPQVRPSNCCGAGAPATS